MKQLKKDISQSKVTIFAIEKTMWRLFAGIGQDVNYFVLNYIMKNKNYLFYSENKNINEVYEDVVKVSKIYDYVIFDKDIFKSKSDLSNLDISVAKNLRSIVRKIKMLSCNFIFMTSTYQSPSGIKMIGGENSYQASLVLLFDGERIKQIKNRFTDPAREINFPIKRLMLNTKLKKVKQTQ